MILPRPEDAIHKIQLYRLLSAFADDRDIAENVYFKGGTCAAMLGFLDRFSIDLDFDLDRQTDKKIMRAKLHDVFDNLNLQVKTESKQSLFFLLKYEAKTTARNTLKLSLVENPPHANRYQPVYFKEIDRYIKAQTIATIVANKLVAPIDRWEKDTSIAGRDIYDIHHFFISHYPYEKKIIEERRKTTVLRYFEELVSFIKTHITETHLSQDLNVLLPAKQFQAIRKTLKSETLLLLADEVQRLS